MIVELLTFGDELLDGRRIDTNTAWLGRRLTALGSPPRFRHSTTDRMDDIARAFTLALSRADVVISTGGLGPTTDDLTFEALARALDKPLVFNPHIHARIEKIFQRRNIPCPPSNRRQAMLPEGAIEIVNDWGTAPGIRVDVGSKMVFCLPGVPLEMENLFERGVFPLLELRLGVQSRRVERTYRFLGLGESRLEELVEKSGIRSIAGAEIRLAYTVSFPLVDVTLSILPAEPKETEKIIEACDDCFRRTLGENLASIGSATLEETLVQKLIERKWTIAVAESTTGGGLSSQIINVPGSSKTFCYGAVTYANESKVRDLGVSPDMIANEGAVSESCALAMAKGVRRVSGADVAVATTGIAGPGGATEDKSVGLTYIAWVGPNFEEVRRYQFRWDRNRNRMQTTFEAILRLIRLLGEE